MSIPQDVVARLNANIVAHTTYQKLSDALARFISTHAGVGNLCFLSGHPGAGKTALLRQVIKQARTQSTDIHEMPAVYVEAPHSATPKNLISSFLTAVGDSFPLKGTEAQMIERLPIVYEGRKVKFVVVDEAQNLLPQKYSSSSNRSIANFFTSIVNKLELPTIIAGTPEISRMRDHGSASRRAARSLKVEPFDLRNQTGIDELYDVIARMLNNEVPLCEWFYESDGTKFLRKNTGGYIGLVTRLLATAADFAIEDDSSLIKQKHLECAASDAGFHNLDYLQTQLFEKAA